MEPILCFQASGAFFRVGASRRLASIGGAASSGWTLHDLRRTMATGLQKLGVRLEVTEAVLNHVSGSRAGIVGVYQRHDMGGGKTRGAHAWGEHVAAIVEGREAEGNVTTVARAERIGETKESAGIGRPADKRVKPARFPRAIRAFARARDMSGEDDRRARILDAAEPLMLRLKEENIKDLEECETLLRQIVVELPIGHPGILLVLFQHALKMVLERRDLTEATKEKVLSAAEEFRALLNVFQAASPMAGGLVFKVASLALLTGLLAGLTPHTVEKLRAGWPAELGRDGGQKSGAVRKANRPWTLHAKELVHRCDPNLSNGGIAAELMRGWKDF